MASDALDSLPLSLDDEKADEEEQRPSFKQELKRGAERAVVLTFHRREQQLQQSEDDRRRWAINAPGDPAEMRERMEVSWS